MSIPREQVFLLIDDERTYQDANKDSRDHRGNPSLEAELLLLDYYIDMARQTWVYSTGNVAVMHELRKIAAIATRALEHYGAHAGPNGPQRTEDGVIYAGKFN